VPQDHALVGFAFGLKIAGMTKNELRGYLEVAKGSSLPRNTPVPHPEAVGRLHQPSPLLDAEPRPRSVLIGGGFTTHDPLRANLLTATYPEFDRGWRSASKDHFTPSPSVLDSFAIGIRERLPVGRVVIGVANRSPGPPGDTPGAVVPLDPSFALTGLGALVHWTEPGVLIWKLAPLRPGPGTSATQGVEAQAKAHVEPSLATIAAWAIGIRLEEDPCR
jgi:hypothetical protein